MTKRKALVIVTNILPTLFYQAKTFFFGLIGFNRAAGGAKVMRGVITASLTLVSVN